MQPQNLLEASELKLQKLNLDVETIFDEFLEMKSTKRDLTI